ncbi:MAG: RRXRR domain-containing protein [Alphaproteobacteria bacterium]
MSIDKTLVRVLDTAYKELSPCKPSVADRLCKAGKAAVFKTDPYTIILKKEVGSREKAKIINCSNRASCDRRVR